MCSQSFCVLPLHQNKKILNRSAWSTQAFKSHYYFFSSLGLSAQGWVRGPVVEQKQVQSCFSQHGLHGPFPGIQWIQLMWIQYWDLLFPSMIGWWSFSYIPAGIFHSCFSELCQQKLLTRMYFPSGWGQVTLSTVMRFLPLLCGYWGFWLFVTPRMGPYLCMCLAGVEPIALHSCSKTHLAGARQCAFTTHSQCLCWFWNRVWGKLQKLTCLTLPTKM